MNMELPIIHFDCKSFLGDRPCLPNKLYDVFCENCSYFEKDPRINIDFPEIRHAPEHFSKLGVTNVVIIKLEAVGDVLRTTAVLPSLKKIYPNSRITWITKTKSLPVLSYNQYIDEVLAVEEHSSSSNFDIAINLDSSTESCEIMSMISAPLKYGYELASHKPYPANDLANEWYLMGVNDKFKKANKKTYYRIIHEICGLDYTGSSPMLNITAERKKRAEEIRARYSLSEYKDFSLINLGGGTRWQYKKWTKEGYASLINKLATLDPEKAYGVIAGAEDKDFYRESLSLVSERENIILFGCDNPVEDFICIIQLANKIFTSDSLAFHIATALGKYVVVIVGPTSHAELDVFGKGRIVYSDSVDCLVCYLNRCDKIVTCMNTIPAEDIVPLMR